MKCIILAAGYATRLYPLTENFPKPLLPVAGKPILDHLIDDLESTGRIDEYIVVSNHKYAACFDEWAKGRGERITMIDDGTISNETRLGAVRDIALALSRGAVDDDTLVLAGDNLLDFSLDKFLSYCEYKNTSCVMRYSEPSIEKLRHCGVLEVDREERVVEMTEKSPEPKSHWACPPFYYYKREDIALVPDAVFDGCGVDAPGSLVAWMCKRRKVHAMEMPGSRYDIGDIESYRETDRIFSEKI